MPYSREICANFSKHINKIFLLSSSYALSPLLPVEGAGRFSFDSKNKGFKLNFYITKILQIQRNTELWQAPSLIHLQILF
jgi:hypothetical protein